MKKLLIPLLFVILFICPVHAEEKKESVKYEITIKTTYNSVGIEEAEKIIADSLRRHKDACKNNVTIKKAGSNLISIGYAVR